MKIKQAILTSTLLVAAFTMRAQDRYFTKTATIQFDSKTDLENIEATNKIVTTVLDTKTGAIQFSAPMKAFEFKKGLMQEHFNENYVESDKYPDGKFKGKITNNADIKYQTPGTYDAKVEGQLTIHGVTKDISSTGKIVVGTGSLDATTTFQILLADYNITIPSLVADKISKSVRIKVMAKLEPLTR